MSNHFIRRPVKYKERAVNNDLLRIHLKILERAQSWRLERAPQIFEPTPSIVKRLALASGKFLIATGEKLVCQSRIAPSMEKKTA